MKYRAIKDNAGRFPIRLMCKALAVSASGYYDWVERPDSARTLANRVLLEDIRTSHRDSRGSYGSPRVTQDLREAGHCVSETRVARLMKAAGVRAKTPRKWRATTQSNHRLPVAGNTLDRGFAVEAANRVWAGDITVSDNGTAFFHRLHWAAKLCAAAVCRGIGRMDSGNGAVDGTREPSIGAPAKGGRAGRDAGGVRAQFRCRGEESVRVQAIADA